jgi:hypothetical protein
MADSVAEDQLASFLARFTPEVAALAKSIRAAMRKQYPFALELVYDNYNALAIGYCPSERPSEGIFSIAVFPQWVSLFFLQAAGLSDPDKILKGSGNVAKHVRLPSAKTLSEPAVAALMADATQKAKVPFDPDNKHRLIIRSVSAKQRPRRPAESTLKPKKKKPKK